MDTFKYFLYLNDASHYGVMQTKTPYFFKGFHFAAKRSPAKVAVLAADYRGGNSG